MQINVYAEKGHADEIDWVNHLIHPIRAYWGDGTLEWNRWLSDFEYYKDLFVLTDELNNSDVVFLPMTLNYYINNKKLDLVDNLVSRAAEVKKTTFVWIDGDHQVRYKNSCCVFLKYSGFLSRSNSNEFILSGDMKKDLLMEYFNGNLIQRRKNKRPTVGFDGIASYPPIKLGLTIVKNSIFKFFHNVFRTQFDTDPIFPSFIKRKRILEQLTHVDELDTNFNIRDSFAIGTIGCNKQARIDFINNIVDNDYTFCYRGAPNYSLRFYETLCLGRIPLFVNTDCMLPFHDKINWDEVCLWVEEHDLKYIGDAILDYHNSLTENEFIERQHYCREIWEKYCDNKGFYAEFCTYLNENYISAKAGDNV